MKSYRPAEVADIYSSKRFLLCSDYKLRRMTERCVASHVTTISASHQTVKGTTESCVKIKGAVKSYYENCYRINYNNIYLLKNQINKCVNRLT